MPIPAPWPQETNAQRLRIQRRRQLAVAPFLRAEPKDTAARGRYMAVILARVLGRVFAPNFYPWLFGLLQLGLVLELGRFWPLWLPIAGGLALALLLATLALVRDPWRLKGTLLVVVIALLTVGPTINAMVTPSRLRFTYLAPHTAIHTNLA